MPKVSFFKDSGCCPKMLDYTLVMLILILIDVQYLQNAVFSFGKGLNGQNHSSSGFQHPINAPPPAKFPSPLNTIWKTLIKLYFRGSDRLSQAVQAKGTDHGWGQGP